MTLRTFMVRRLLGRLRLDDDTVRHLSTFQRLGETLEIQPPGEMLPIGARTVFRALRTRAASQIGDEWVWPYWLNRQVDPTSASFVPRGHLPFLTNVTARNWTMIGNLDSPWEGTVDPRGLVTPWNDGWSLDWWVGAEDRWHVPSDEVTVRQTVVKATPVVETRLRVPGGDIVQRAYAIVATTPDGNDDLAIVEFTNESNVPVVLALGVRPYNTEGLSVIERIGLVDDTVVTVDGRVGMLLPGPPRDAVASTFHDGDCSAQVFRNEARPVKEFPDDLRDDAGMAQAAFLYPLAHTATLSVALPLAPQPRTRRRGRVRRRLASAPRYPSALPTSDQVARGWHTQTDRGMRVVVPHRPLQEAIDANRRYLLLFHDGDDITPGPTTYHRFWFRDAAYMLAALDGYGFHDEARSVIRTFPDRQHHDGYFFSQRLEWDANGAAIWAMRNHLALAPDPDFRTALVPSIASGVQWIENHRRSRKRDDPAVRGLLPASISAEHLGPFDYFYWDDFWALAGLRDGAALLRDAGETDAADDAERFLGSMSQDVRASMRLTAERLGTVAIPAGPRRRIDSAVIGSLVAASPLQLLPADGPEISATLDVVRDRFLQGDAFYQRISHTGLGTYLTMQVAFVELLRGEADLAWSRLKWMLEAATPTYTWPEAIHPQGGGGCMGDGHHGWAAAEFLNFVRAMLVRETADGIAIASVFPSEWFGQGVEVHDAPTTFGRVSYAIRWHGERPALLWEVEPRGDEAVRLTAPGLDPTFVTTERSGETLLAPPVERQPT